MAETLKQTKLKPALIKALTESLGNIALACKKLEISRQTYYNILKEDLNFVKEVNEIQETALDFVESKLMKAIEKGNITAIIYFLNNKGRMRGYSYGISDTRISIRNEAPRSETENLNAALELIQKIKSAKPQMKLIKADNIA